MEASNEVVFTNRGIKMTYNASTAEEKLDIIDLPRLRALVESRTEAGAFGYVDGGSSDEQVLQDNETAFRHYQLIPRMLQNIAEPDMTTTLFDIPLGMPIIAAPIAAQGLMHEGGESVTVKGVGAAKSIFSASTYGNASVAAVAEASPETPKFFQLYMSRDDEFNQFLINQAVETGYKAIILTADSTLGGYREADIINNFEFPLPMDNLAAFSNAAGTGEGLSIAEIYARAKQDLALSDIKKIKDMASGLPVIVKGIQDPEDALAAIAGGADGIWVSNHGGRELNGAPASIDVLADIAKAVNHRVPIIFDSGIRWGEDIAKAIALGADVVALGRPMLWALNLGGAAGVQSAYEHLAEELKIVMQLTGSHTVAELKHAKIIEAKF